jgi:hypothetical protein
MAVTTQQLEYARLRSYLNPYLKGPNVTAVLNALAAGNSSYLINNAAAINDQMYITTASGAYLDQLLSQYGLERPADVGLSDITFSQIGIAVKNRKQVRDLLAHILNLIFGDIATRATDDSVVETVFSPGVTGYPLADGDTLIVNFDDHQTSTITFTADMFENIAQAKAIEVADAISETLRNNELTGVATTQNDGYGNYVQLMSDAIGPASAVTVLGGSAQNVLQFPALVSVGGDPTTTWDVSVQPGGLLRFTWVGGTDPNIGLVSVGNYVNIYGGGFLNSSYEGTYPIVMAVGGAVNLSYFEVLDPIASNATYKFTSSPATASANSTYTNNGFTFTILDALSDATVFVTDSNGPPTPSGMLEKVTGTGDNTILFNTSSLFNPVTNGGTFASPTINFYNPVRETIASRPLYAAIYQTQGGFLQIFLPASTTIIRRTRIGSAHLHDQPVEFYTFTGNPNPGDMFAITTVNTLVAGTSFVINSNYLTTMANMAAAINAISGLVAIVGVDPYTKLNVVRVFQESPSLTLVGTYTGAGPITASGPKGDPISVQPNQPGPYSYDLTQPFSVSDVETVLTQSLSGLDPDVFTVANSTNFPNGPGYLVFEYGTENQEGPVPYTARPSDTTLLISPAYTIQKVHPVGSDVSLVYRGSVTLTQDGLDYPFYITDAVSGRLYAESLIQLVAAAGISVVFTILYPDDIGLGKWGTIYTENPIIWGPDEPTGNSNYIIVGD